jgi:hypothetical protein
MLLASSTDKLLASMDTTSTRDGQAMNRRAIQWVVLVGIMVGFTSAGAELQAHHAVAGVYDLNTEIVLEGRLQKLNYRNPHANLILEVPSEDGTTIEWVLTTASTQVLGRAGVNRDSIKPGEFLRVPALPALNGNPAGFVRRLELSDREIELEID